MRHSLICTAIALIELCGCTGASVDSGLITTSARAVVTTRYVDNKAAGFSFALASMVPVPNPSNVTPDLFVLVQIDQGGTITGVFFSAGPFRPAFRLLHESSIDDSASSYFNNLTEVPDSSYTELAIPVRQNQVWAVKTHDDKFAKIRVLSTVAYDDTSSPTAPPYGEAIFDWAYQPNGSRHF